MKITPAREHPCITTDFGDQNVWIIGGEGLRSVIRYDVRNDSWDESVPYLNVARSQASACYLAGAVYVFFGMDKDTYFLNSVEKLSVSDYSHQLQQASHWEFL